MLLTIRNNANTSNRLLTFIILKVSRPNGETSSISRMVSIAKSSMSKLIPENKAKASIVDEVTGAIMNECLCFLKTQNGPRAKIMVRAANPSEYKVVILTKRELL